MWTLKTGTPKLKVPRAFLVHVPTEQVTRSGRVSKLPRDYVCTEMLGRRPTTKTKTPERKQSTCVTPQAIPLVDSLAYVDPVQARLAELESLRAAAVGPIASTSAPPTDAPIYTRTNPNPKSIAPPCNTDAERWPAWYLDPTIPWGGVVPKEEPDGVIE